jgi:hypothetical protein
VEEGWTKPSLSRTGESNLKRNMIFFRYLATSVIAATTLVSAQQPTKPAPTGTNKPTPSSASGPQANMTAEQITDSTIQLMRQDIRSQRKKIVAANLPLTETEATRFWPLYDRYIGETIKVNDVRYALIKEYANNYQTTSDQQADSFIKRWIALDQDSAQLRLKFIPEFEKVISPKKTAMFFQIDRRLGMLIEVQLASQIPLLNP